MTVSVDSSRQINIRLGTQSGKQIVALKNKSDLLAPDFGPFVISYTCQVTSINVEVTGRWSQSHSHQIKQRGFATATRALDSHKLTFFERHIDAA